MSIYNFTLSVASGILFILGGGDSYPEVLKTYSWFCAHGSELVCQGSNLDMLYARKVFTHCTISPAPASGFRYYFYIP